MSRYNINGFFFGYIGAKIKLKGEPPKREK